MPPSRHSAHPAHHPHPNARGPHHGPGINGPLPPNGANSSGGGGGGGAGPNGPPMHPHSNAYGHSMPPPDLPPHAMNGAGGPPPRMMMGADGPMPPAPPPHIPRSSSAASHHMMDVGGPNGGAAGGGPAVGVSASAAVQKLTQANEQTWISIGTAAETMEDFERALSAYESALRHNPYSVPALSAIAGVHRTLDNFEKAVDYFQRVLNIVPENGDTWGSMGHCYLMMDDLQRAYTAYQQALYHLPNPKEPKLWYGIGILYDRYGSLEHAEEAFASVVRMDPNYEKANEIYFRLGIIYKQQNKFAASLECFRYILTNPPRPLTEIDIWFQIGHVYEQQKDFALAKEAYERVLAENPAHAKVLQQLGWLYHQSNAGFNNQERAIQFLTQSLESDPNDAQSWYLLGRAYMAGQNYNKAYEAYQQAVYRDGKNPTFWCSIGVLYYQINQFRDALDAYSRAIRLNPFISEVWFDLGSLYESCNNQISDAIDAYARAAELDPDNPHIQQRLVLLRNAEAKGEQVPSAPMPQDVHPTAYANNNGMPPGPPAQIGGDVGDRELPGPGHLQPQQQGHSPPFRGGPPPIPNIDERGTRGPAHTPLAPMNTGQGGPPGGPPGLGPGGEPLHRGGAYPPHPQSRGPSPAPRADMYGRRMGSPPRQTPPFGPPGAMRPDLHDGHDFRGGPHGGPPPPSGPPVDHYGRPLAGPAAEREREREREMEWERERDRERERAARQYPGSGRATPKIEPGYPRSQHGSNAPSPAFSRPGAYPREDPREYYGNGGGGYDRARMDEGRPPYEHERGYGRHHDHPMAERYEGGGGPRQHPPADLRGPTPERDRMRGEYPPSAHPAFGPAGGAGPPPPPPPASDGVGDAMAAGGRPPAKGGRRGHKFKDDGDVASGPASPAPSAAAARKKKEAGGAGGPSSRASSPWGGRPNAPASASVGADYDEGAADALMGLAGAASASASMPAPSAPQQPRESQQPSPRGHESGQAWDGPPSGRSSPRKASDSDAPYPPRARAESALGKRPYDEGESAGSLEESTKRARNGASPGGAGPGRSEDSVDAPPRPDARPSSPLKPRNGAHEAEDAEMGVKSPPPPPPTASHRAPSRSPSKDSAPSPTKAESRGTPPKPQPEADSGADESRRDMDVDEPASGGAAGPKEGAGGGDDGAAAKPAKVAEVEEGEADNEEEGQISETGDDAAASGKPKADGAGDAK
ncbi:uncharacterized protein PFL1_05157 [Pseudozyma flocculosa PF-1]|uniref:Uncharacterized protein n=1 Tax=Pseudozyma flocculosa PF-1 TaxID=1277687 RepID=A0A061H4A3_9BASI|nr:uncharacterized protein PFL1_05157 [Pseudozyma flocculosa PF-1]EPQ27234.1 hypothetical protein PFL1_05157 [Pseudozyma flocculosa PF-1]